MIRILPPAIHRPPASRKAVVINPNRDISRTSGIFRTTTPDKTEVNMLATVSFQRLMKTVGINIHRLVPLDILNPNIMIIVIQKIAANLNTTTLHVTGKIPCALKL